MQLIQKRMSVMKSQTLPDWLDDNVKFHMEIGDSYKSQYRETKSLT